MILWALVQFFSNVRVERMRIASEIGINEVRYQSLRPILTTTKKDTFEKLVTLLQASLNYRTIIFNRHCSKFILWLIVNKPEAQAEETVA